MPTWKSFRKILSDKTNMKRIPVMPRLHIKSRCDSCIFKKSGEMKNRYYGEQELIGDVKCSHGMIDLALCSKREGIPE